MTGSRGDPRAGARSWLGRHGVKVAASLLVGAGFVWLLHEGALPLIPDGDTFGRVRWWTVPVCTLIWIGVLLLRAVRWHWLLLPVRRVPLRTVLPVALVGFAAILALPFRTGEVVRPVLIHRRGGVSGWAAAGTVAAERILDGLILSGLLLAMLQWAKPLDPLPDRIGDLPISPAVVPMAAYAAVALFVGAFAVMGMFYWRRQWARRATRATVGLVSPVLADWLAERVERVAEGLGFLPQPRALVPIAVITVAYWALNGAGAWLLAWGCGFDSITFPQAYVNIGVVALGMLTPNAPGFFGAFQMASYAGFAMYFPVTDVVTSGAAFVFISYLAQLAITLGFGLGAAMVARTSLVEGLGSDPEELDADSGAADPAER